MTVWAQLKPARQTDGLQAGQEAYTRGDYSTAMRELLPFAEQGNKEAQFTVGWMYGKTRTPPNYAEAMKWFRLAAEQGHANAQLNIGHYRPHV